MINIHRIINGTRVEGPGNRIAIWFQGCSRQCEGCFVQETWDKSPKKLYDEEQLAQLINKSIGIEGITILGGEPFEQVEGLKKLLMEIDKKYSIIVFTGYKLEELQERNDDRIESIFKRIDVLVDGEYISGRRDLSRPMVGSDNQRFIFFTERYSIEDFPPNNIEVRVEKNGNVLINGNGNIERIELK